jgi:hypothetical protein
MAEIIPQNAIFIIAGRKTVYFSFLARNSKRATNNKMPIGK